MTTPKLIDPPKGFDHRVKLARHRPESLAMMPCDVGYLLGLGPSGVYDRDAQLKPARLNLKARQTRRYSWANYLAYVAGVGVGATD